MFWRHLLKERLKPVKVVLADITNAKEAGGAGGAGAVAVFGLLRRSSSVHDVILQCGKQDAHASPLYFTDKYPVGIEQDQ